MSSFRISTIAVAVTAVVALLWGLGTPTADAAAKRTADGHLIVLDATSTKIRKVPPLDSGPLSTEAFITSDVTAKITRITEENQVKAHLEIGFQVGYPAGIPDGVDVTLNTPSVTVTGGVNAGITPGIGADIGTAVTVSPSISGNIGANAGISSDIIPSQQLAFSVKPGGITEKKIAEIDMTTPEFNMYLEGVQIAVNSAIGPVSVRPYARITVTTKAGFYTLNSYGKARTFGVI